MDEATYEVAHRLMKERLSIEGDLRLWERDDQTSAKVLGSYYDNTPDELFDAFKSNVINALRVRIYEINQEISTL